MNSLIPLFVIAPLGAAFIMAVLGRFINNFNKVLLPVVMLFLSYLSVYFLLNTNGTLIYRVGGFEAVQGVPIAIYMVIDGLSRLLLLIISLIGFLSAFYATSYVSIYTAERKFFILFSLMVAGMNGIVISGDIFNIFVFLEIASIASYALVAFGIEKKELEASFKYQVLGGIASLIILLSIGFIYWQTGTLNIADISGQLAAGGIFVRLVAVLFIAGFGLKAAIFPFHSWLPDAHSSAPSPISAMLSGVLIKAVGLYVLFRLFFNMFALSYELAMIVTVLGTLSMVIGGLLAIGQWDIKRLLAFSSISQVGYVVIGVGIGMLILSRGGDTKIASLAIIGGLFHLLNHSVFKSLLFLGAGSVEFRTGERDIRKLGGLHDLMPVTSSSSMIASLAISGMPPFNGFFSKLIIIVAAVQARYYFLAILAVAISIVTIAYFMKLQKFTFYNRDSSFWKGKGIKEAPFTMCFSMIILMILCLALSLLMVPGLKDIILTPAVNVLIEGQNYSTTILGY